MHASITNTLLLRMGRLVGNMLGFCQTPPGREEGVAAGASGYWRSGSCAQFPGGGVGAPRQARISYEETKQSHGRSLRIISRNSEPPCDELADSGRCTEGGLMVGRRTNARREGVPTVWLPTEKTWDKNKE